MTRPLYWLTREYHDVMRLCRIGHTALQSAINHASSHWGKGPIDLKTYELLLPHSDFTFPNKNEKLPTSSFWAAVCFEVPFLEHTVTPISLMRRQDLVGWWRRHILPTDMTIEAFTSATSDPVELVKLGYEMLRDRFFFEPDFGRTYGACLSMIGAGAVALVCSRACSLCRFRRAEYSTDRCALCTMSKSVVSLELLDKQAALTRKRRRIFQVSGSTLGEFINRDIEESAGRALAAILTSMVRRSDEYRAWSNKLKNSLELAPDISSQLARNFSRLSPSEKLSVLRKVIDPLEYDYASWPQKILAAQRWAQAEAAVAARKKISGPTQSTIEKGRHARSLISTGLTRVEAAEQMGISSSNLSHILRRTKEASQSL